MLFFYNFDFLKKYVPNLRNKYIIRNFKFLSLTIKKRKVEIRKDFKMFFTHFTFFNLEFFTNSSWENITKYENTTK